MQYDTKQYNTIKWNTIQFNTIQRNTMHYNIMNTIQKKIHWLNWTYVLRLFLRLVALFLIAYVLWDPKRPAWSHNHSLSDFMFCEFLRTWRTSFQFVSTRNIMRSNTIHYLHLFLGTGRLKKMGRCLAPNFLDSWVTRIKVLLIFQ